jgi:hypothetical protein
MYMSAFLAMQHAAHACQHIILVFVGKFRTWYLGLGTSCHVVKTVMSETAMFENVMFATARFETVMCESVMFDSVMFETVRWARRDCFMNTPVAAAWLGCHMESVTSIKSLAGSHGAEYCTAHASKAHTVENSMRTSSFNNVMRTSSFAMPWTLVRIISCAATT